MFVFKRKSYGDTVAVHYCTSEILIKKFGVDLPLMYCGMYIEVDYNFNEDDWKAGKIVKEKLNES